MNRILLASSLLFGTLAFGTAGAAQAQDATSGATTQASPAVPASSDAAPGASSDVAPGATSAASSAPAASDPTAPGPFSQQAVPQAYLSGTQSLSVDQIAAFLADPSTVFEGRTLPAQISRQVRMLVGSDNRTVQAVIDLTKRPETGPDRLGPIAVGLAEATRSAPPTSIEYGAYIQEAVARSGSEELIAAYGAVLQTVEVETAALGAAAGGGGTGPSSGSLGGVGAPGNSNGFNGDDTVPQAEGTFGTSSNGSVSYTDDNNDDDGLDTLALRRCTDASPTEPCVILVTP